MATIRWFFVGAAVLLLGCERAATSTATVEPTPVTAPAPAQPRWGLVIHGGAGTIDPENLSPEQEAEYRATLNAALDAGYAVLDRGGASLDAVEAAIMVMEDSPLFNAGKGAVFTHDGHNELDASVMDGATGKAGAVAGVRQVKNPIQAARAVMQASPHVMLSGAGADAFAAEQGLTRVEPDYFKTPMRWQQLQRALGSDSVALDHDLPPPGADKFGTVGAVAVDKQGHLAAATSTGGMTNKRWGRIGDSPIIGAGTYADDETCAVSATGHGEFFIREAVAHSVCARMAFGGASLPDAAHAVVFEQLDPTGGTGGIIAVDANGVMATPFNTPGMYRAHRFSDGTRDAFIWTAEHPREAQAHAASSEGGER